MMYDIPEGDRERIGSWTTSDEDNVIAAYRSAIKGSDIPTVTILESFCINGDRYTAVTKVNERCRVTELKKHILFKGNTEMPGVVFRSVSMQSMITTIRHEILNCPELNILHEICLSSLLTLLWFLGNALMYRPNKEGKVIAIQGASNTDKSTLVGICNQLPGTLSTTGPSELVTSDSTKSGRELRNISGFELVCLPDVHHSEKDAISMKSVKILTSTDSVADENGSVIVMSKVVIYTTNNLVQQPTNQPTRMSG